MGELAKLEAFERAVYCRPRADRLEENRIAVDALRQCLLALREGMPFECGMDTDSITRMASAVVALFCDPQFRLTQDGFDFMSSDRVVLDTIFRASVYDGSDFVFGLLDENTEHLNKYLLLFSIGSKLNLDLESIFRKSPQETFGLWLSLVSYGQVLSPEAHERREHLLSLAPVFANVNVPPVLFNTICGAYMHCSYASGRDKHDIKRVIHGIMARAMGVDKQPELPGALRKARPKILVVHEWWGPQHAMYRSYAKSIMQLKRDFDLVGMKPGKDEDESARAIFDEWIELDGENLNLSDVAGKIREVGADIIYYPSIGMSIWVIAMASLRLAPIQVMTYGHPATSNSPVIDYGLIESDCYVEDRFSERVIPLPPQTVRPTEFKAVPQRHVPRKTDTIRIGVTAMQVKVSWPFMRALQQIQERAGKRVEIHFFSAAHGIGLFSMCREVGNLLENTTAHEKQSYDGYMESLHQMDILLFSFPFGGANSTYDALTVGVPMVSMEGDEPHSRSDASIVRRAGLPDSLIAHTEAEYVEAVLRLMDDDERARIAGLVRAVDVEQMYSPDEGHAFVDAFIRIYRDNTLVQVPDFPVFVKEAA